MYSGTAHVIVAIGPDRGRGDDMPELLPGFPTSKPSDAPCSIWACLWSSGLPYPGARRRRRRQPIRCARPQTNSPRRGWRRIGTAVVRWPGPVLAATVVALVGLLALPAYTTNYNDRYYIPAYTPANVGYHASDRHFPPARMEPELLMVESDHECATRPT